MKQVQLEQGGVAPEVELFGALLAAQCSCESQDAQCGCSENAWLGKAKAFVRSYSVAVVEARGATPDCAAWWSASSGRPPVPRLLEEYLELMEFPGISVNARAQMAAYLEGFLPGYRKERGQSQDPACAEQMGYRSAIAIHYFRPGVA
jgi:hypothetical protein